MNKKNCWEVKQCGRQAGGAHVGEFGECPAARCFAAHGINQGMNGGRACWAIAGTFCKGTVQGHFVSKIKGCAECDFFHQVFDEEGKDFVKVQEIASRIKG